MTNNTHSSELDDLFDDIRNTCGDCKHPRCLSIIKSAKGIIASERQKAVDEYKQDRIVKNKSLCGCPMCEHHTVPYEANEDKTV